jgi:hypothetical protein
MARFIREKVLMRKTGASTTVARRVLRFMRAVWSLAVSIGAMILGAAVLGCVIAGVSGVVLAAIGPSETGSRALANLDQSGPPANGGDFIEARSASVDWKSAAAGRCESAGVGRGAESAASID